MLWLLLLLLLIPLLLLLLLLLLQVAYDVFGWEKLEGVMMREWDVKRKESLWRIVRVVVKAFGDYHEARLADFPDEG